MGLAHRIGLVAACLFQGVCPAVLHAQIVPVPGTVKELEKPTEPVSGSAAMGLAQAPVTARGGEIMRLQLHFPTAYSGRVRLEISSADGRYKGTALYDVKAVANGEVPISFPSRKLDLLNQYGADTLALRVTGADGDEPRFILASYGAGAPQTLVYINSANSDIFLFDAATRKLRQCERVTKVPGVTFDTVCRIAALPADRIILRRIRGAERLDPIILNF